MTRCTLAKMAAHLIEVKHSRFLAQATTIDCADAVQTALTLLTDPAATQCCWAWRVGS